MSLREDALTGDCGQRRGYRAFRHLAARSMLQIFGFQTNRTFPLRRNLHRSTSYGIGHFELYFSHRMSSRCTGCALHSGRVTFVGEIHASGRTDCSCETQRIIFHSKNARTAMSSLLCCGAGALSKPCCSRLRNWSSMLSCGKRLCIYLLGWFPTLLDSCGILREEFLLNVLFTK